MALSNWDMLAVDLDGPSRGTFVCEETEVAIYKNWLYLRDSVAWHAGTGWSRPTVCQITEGSLRYKNLEIIARRGPQDGVFAIVKHGFGDELRVMAGCGVSGYSDDARPCGHVEDPMSCGPETGDAWVCARCAGPVPRQEYVGVSEESRLFLGKMVLEEFEPGTRVASQLMAGLLVAVRFNQGDAFFADTLGTQVPGSSVDDARPPVIEDLIKEL